MKKLILTVVLACTTVVSYAQEQPTTQEKHVCTEQCDHSAKKEIKSCCATASAEGKECIKWFHKKKWLVQTKKSARWALFFYSSKLDR
jgi:hypothetical protein